MDAFVAPPEPEERRADLIRRGLIVVREDGVNITTIGCMRFLAEQTGERDGQDDPEWLGRDGRWKKAWVSDDPPVAARVRIYRKGHAKGFPGVAFYSACVQLDEYGEPMPFWKRSPAGQLVKCAEAAGYRMGWPGEIDGLYSQEEMGQAANRPTATDVAIDTKLYLTAIAAASDVAAMEKLGRQLAKTIPQDHPAYAEIGEAYQAKLDEFERDTRVA
jgi:hypothetical protein